MAKNSINNMLKDGLNVLNKRSPSSNPASSPTTPWDGLDTVSKEVYFKANEILGDRWDKIFPYRFVVVDSANENQIVARSSSSNSVEYSIRDQLDSSKIDVVFNNAWIATLPITPQGLNITTIPAVTNTPALRGVVEEHNGVKYKMINLNCSTGIYPARSGKSNSIKASPPLATIAAGTLSSLGALKATLDSIKGGSSVASPASESIDTSQTGYYHALYIDQFIEQYLIAKKHPSAKSWRLVFDIPKQNTSYYVTPGPFSLIQNAQKPMEWTWTIQLKAWKRIKINESRPKAPISIKNDYQKIVNLISSGRIAIQQFYSVVRSVRSDVTGVANNLRQVMLLCKEIGGLALDLGDMSSYIIQPAESVISKELQDITDLFNDKATKNKIKSLNSLNTQNENLSLSQVNSKAIGKQMKDLTESSPALNIFKEVDKNFSILKEINIDSIPLNQFQQLAIEKEKEKASQLTSQDIKNIRFDLQNLYLDLSNKLGTNKSTVNKIYNRPSPKSRPYPLSLDETPLLYGLFDAIQGIDLLTSTREIDESRKLSPIKYIKEIASEYNINIEDNPSKILVPVPFGLSIEQISQRYLKDDKRWIEIATLNSLRAPYIDEDGFTRFLLTNADNRQFTLNSSENLFVGQKIILSSNTVSPFTRNIAEIEKINNNSYLITVDGQSNLGDLKTIDQAKIKAYLPATVNSQDSIFIPTNTPAPEFMSPTITQGIPIDTLSSITKTDFLLDDNMDIALDSNGDFRFSTGLTNLIQALKIKLLTKKGTYLLHPEFGLSAAQGMPIADIETGKIFNEINSLILQDSRFSRIERMTIELEESALKISLHVIPTGDSGIIPISFTV
jgi:hypothetical protein